MRRATFAGRTPSFLRTHVAYVVVVNFFWTLEPQKSGVRLTLTVILGSFGLSELLSIDWYRSLSEFISFQNHHNPPY